MAAVASFAAVTGIGIGFRLMRAQPADQRGGAPAVQAAAPQPPVVASAPLELAAPAPPPPPPEPSAEATAPAPSAAAEPEPSASAPAAASEAAQSAHALRDEALSLLNKSKNPEAMVKASEALEKDPTDAMPYLVLGSALQDANRWKEAHHAYEVCTKTAKKGMVDECRAMLRGGH
jgi:hypothetical protein